MPKLDPRIEEVRKKYDLSGDDFWELPQRKGTWIAKHAALEVAAAKAGIVFDLPQIHEAFGEQGVVCMVVQGRMGDRTEWATGETNSTNYKVTGKQPSYPWAMAEKRAKDRVILKLIGIHGLVYSEDEGDFTQSKAKSREPFKQLQADLRGCRNLKELAAFWGNPEVQAQIKALPTDWRDDLTAEKDQMKSDLQELQGEVDQHFPPDTQAAMDNMRTI